MLTCNTLVFYLYLWSAVVKLWFADLACFVIPEHDASLLILSGFVLIMFKQF